MKLTDDWKKWLASTVWDEARLGPSRIVHKAITEFGADRVGTIKAVKKQFLTNSGYTDPLNELTSEDLRLFAILDEVATRYPQYSIYPAWTPLRTGVDQAISSHIESGAWDASTMGPEPDWDSSDFTPSEIIDYISLIKKQSARLGGHEIPLTPAEVKLAQDLDSGKRQRPPVSSSGTVTDPPFTIPADIVGDDLVWLTTDTMFVHPTIPSLSIPKQSTFIPSSRIRRLKHAALRRHQASHPSVVTATPVTVPGMIHNIKEPIPQLSIAWPTSLGVMPTNWASLSQNEKIALVKDGLNKRSVPPPVPPAIWKPEWGAEPTTYSSMTPQQRLYYWRNVRQYTGRLSQIGTPLDPLQKDGDKLNPVITQPASPQSHVASKPSVPTWNAKFGIRPPQWSSVKTAKDAEALFRSLGYLGPMDGFFPDIDEALLRAKAIQIDPGYANLDLLTLYITVSSLDDITIPTEGATVNNNQLLTLEDMMARPQIITNDPANPSQTELDFADTPLFNPPNQVLFPATDPITDAHDPESLTFSDRSISVSPVRPVPASPNRLSRSPGYMPGHYMVKAERASHGLVHPDSTIPLIFVEVGEIEVEAYPYATQFPSPGLNFLFSESFSPDDGLTRLIEKSVTLTASANKVTLDASVLTGADSKFITTTDFIVELGINHDKEVPKAAHVLQWTFTDHRGVVHNSGPFRFKKLVSGSVKLRIITVEVIDGRAYPTLAVIGSRPAGSRYSYVAGDFPVNGSLVVTLAQGPLSTYMNVIVHSNSFNEPNTLVSSVVNAV